eukprot:2208901-Rhodomonas_salina.1
MYLVKNLLIANAIHQRGDPTLRTFLLSHLGPAPLCHGALNLRSRHRLQEVISMLSQQEFLQASWLVGA